MAAVMKILSVLWQLTLITLVSLSGDKLVQVSHLPLPGSVAGMALLYLLLSVGLVRVSQLQQVTEFLLKHMAFFFVPITVGLMNYWEIFHSHGLVLLGLLSVSLVLAFLIFRLTSFKHEGRN